jgi:hypothetical protein
MERWVNVKLAIRENPHNPPPMRGSKKDSVQRRQSTQKVFVKNIIGVLYF